MRPKFQGQFQESASVCVCSRARTQERRKSRRDRETAREGREEKKKPESGWERGRGKRADDGEDKSTGAKEPRARETTPHTHTSTPHTPNLEGLLDVVALEVIGRVAGNGDVVIVNHELHVEVASRREARRLRVIALLLRSVRAQAPCDLVGIRHRHSVHHRPHLQMSVRV